MKRMRQIDIPMSWKHARYTNSGSEESFNACCSDSESVYSLQQQDTDQPKDTSDSDIDEDTPSEYEVAALSPRKPNPFFSTDDSDEMHELNEIAALGVVAATVDANLSDSIDLGQLADTSTPASSSPTSNSDVDPGLPRLDYLDFWTCAQCKAENANRHVPFCATCYTMRKSFFPTRPRRRRLHLTPKAVTGLSSVSSSAASVDVVDGPLPLLSSVKTETDSAASVDIVDGPLPSQSSVKTETDSGIDSATSTVRNSFTEMCQLCLSNPVDGLFSHGRTVHLYGCYSCAKQTWKLMGCCPLCRKKIDRVQKLLIG